MRIAFFVRSFPEISETFLLRQVTGLLDRGHDVRIFAYRVASGGPVHHAVAAYDLPSRVRVLPRRGQPAAAFGEPPPAGRPSLAAGLGAARAIRLEHARALGGWRTLARTLRALLAHEPFDIVHAHYGEVGLRYRTAARLWAAPLITSFYGHDSSAVPAARGQGIYRPIFRSAAAITSLSEHMDRQLEALGCPASRLRRVPLAVEPADFPHIQRTARDPDQPLRLLTVARLTEKKGLEYALAALALVRTRLPDVHYEIIGDGPLRGRLQAITRELGLDPSVRFLGWRTSSEVREAMARADLFVLPSVTATDGDEEGTPTVLLEAALSGLPVLSTLHAGIPEIVLHGETGYLVPQRNELALADGLCLLAESPAMRAQLGAAARYRAAGIHATPVVAERLERIYEEVTAARPPERSPARTAAAVMHRSIS